MDVRQAQQLVHKFVVTPNDLEPILHQRKGAQMVSFIALTEPDMRAKDAQGNPNPFRTGKGKSEVIHLRKRSHVNGVIGWNYANAVNAQRLREGQPADFVAKDRKWGLRRKDSPMVDHKGNVHLEVKVEHSLGHVYLDDNNNIVPDELVKPFLTPKSESSRQDLEKEVMLRDYNLLTMEEFRVGGCVFIVIPEDAVSRLVA